MSKKFFFSRISITILVCILGLALLSVLVFSSSPQSLPLPFTHPSPTITPIMTDGSITLTKNTPLALDGTSLTLTLTSVSVPSKNCRDCITRANITVTNGTEEKVMTYTSGGIAGSMPKPLTAFGYTFTLESIDTSSVILTYEK